MKFSLDRHRIDKIPRDDMVAELKRVAEVYEFRRFSGWEIDKVSNLCKRSAVINEFSSWDKALIATGLDLKPHRNKRRDTIPEKELFQELERVWLLLGHRPSKTEWESIKTEYSYTTYKSRFEGWVNACAAFIDFKSDANATAFDKENSVKEGTFAKTRTEIRDEEKRTIPLRLRLEVLKRDQFRYSFCGSSPAIESGVVLHIDHKQPFSKDGKTTLENLQCLCADCNLGKGNKDF
ncbi:MAG: homing endonuclease associated repeat-containing protein [Planctomycetota bacterium]|jgi:5-methylcytosine-specific restriction endonuclease McrA